jgi:hypothetical protein
MLEICLRYSPSGTKIQDKFLFDVETVSFSHLIVLGLIWKIANQF